MISCLLIAARNKLRTSMAVPGTGQAANYIGIQPGGEPPPRSGEWYIAIDEGSVSSTEKESLREVYDVVVTISRRTGAYAPDRRGDIYLANVSGMDALERQVIKYLHNRQDVRVAANAARPTDGEDPPVAIGDIFQTPLFYTGRSPTRFEGPEWSSEEGGSGWMVRVLNFNGGIRVQALDVLG